ncbi:hypothetical protein [Bradyrhizobium sp. USDA 313]
MIDAPEVKPYSVAARICLGVAIFGCALLVATVLASVVAVE